MAPSRSRIASVLTLAALVSLSLATAPADASRAPTRAEAKAIKKGFLKGRPAGTKVKRIRVSTVDKRFSAVTYTANVRELERPPASSAKAKKAPSPVVLKKSGAKWKPVASEKLAKKVKSDLKEKPASSLRISGDVNAFFTQPASCTRSGDFYSASLYDRGADIYLSIQINRFRGFGFYPALSVRSLASLAVGNSGTTPQYETGQGNDAFSPSGEIYVDRDGWGIIEAGMSKIPDEQTYPETISVSGTFDCR